jgi:serine phosphatase RsbU (regulator of sigma subunit)
MPFFTVRSHDDDVFRFEFSSSSVRIGRSSENDLVLKDPAVSRFHAMVECRSDGPHVVDLGSRSGTFVNTRRIQDPNPIMEGDTIHIGRTKLTFGTWSAPSVQLDETLPSSESQTTRISLDEISADSCPGGPIEPLTDPPLAGFLAELDNELALDRPLAELYRRAIEIAGKAVPFERAVLLTLEDDQLVPQAQRTSRDAPSDSISFSRSIADEAIRERQAILVQDAQREFPGSESVAGFSIRSAMCVPLWHHEDIEGILYVDSSTRPHSFSERSLQVLTHLARIVAIKIENKRLFDERLKASTIAEGLRRAQEIQNQFLPSRPPHIEGYRLHGFNRPSFLVGGDFYNYFPLADHRYGIALGDVAGNGLPAALLMCAVQPLLRAMVDGPGGPDEALSRLNRFLCQQIPVNRFITVFLGVLDLKDHAVTFASAGQNPPLLVQPGGNVTRLDPTGLPLGIIEEASYGTGRVSLAPGSTLVVYSDGLTELSNPSGDEFGEARLAATAVEAVGQPPEAMLGLMLQAAENHAGHDANEDDITALILRRDG